MSLRAVVYSRVSTQDQTADNQIDALIKLANARDYQIVRFYNETESAWKEGHQKELARLKKDAGRRRFDVVLVWALDRLSREGALAILTLVHTLKNYGVRVISYQEAWTEAPGAVADILYSIAGWVAEMESQRRSERTKAGLARLIAQGKKLGRPLGSKNKIKKDRSKLKLEAQS